MTATLAEIREAILRCDRIIAQTLIERNKLSVEVARQKLAGELPFLNLDREREIEENLLAAAGEDAIDREFFPMLAWILIGQSCLIQTKTASTEKSLQTFHGLIAESTEIKEIIGRLSEIIGDATGLTAPEIHDSYVKVIHWATLVQTCRLILHQT